MKNLSKYIPFSALALAVGLSACHNADNEFDDFDGGISVYFPYQTPVRTLVMGEDTYNTDLDNAHKCKISTTMGGSYTGKNIKVVVAKDESLLDNLYFKGNFNDGKKVEAMPESYYTMDSNTMDFNGKMSGSVEVTLTDAFFADEKSITGVYVIPLVIESQSGANQIKEGEFDTEVYSSKPQRTNGDAWKKKPMDYTLFSINYISKFAGYFSRNITERNGEPQSREEGKTLLDDPIVQTKTLALDKVSYSPEGLGLTCNLILTFDGNQMCTITTDDPGMTVSGEGQYKDHSEIKAWGDKDRDGLYLNYTISDGTTTVSAKETLVLQRRGVKLVTFDTEIKEGE